MAKISCYNVKNEISDFIEYRLSTKQASEMVEHLISCEDCMEELKLMLIVKACMEDNGIFDIDEYADKELNKRFRDIRRRVYFMDMMERNMRYFVVGASIFLIIGFIMDILL